MKKNNQKNIIKSKTGKIIFLDFDGVVNTPGIYSLYEKRKGKKVIECRYAWPQDGFVNNLEAVYLLNTLYDVIHYEIVITSTWREHERSHTAEECLRNSGLDKKIKVIGKLDKGINRSALINKWIEDNKFTGDYLIFDDEDFYTEKGYYRPKNYKEMSKKFIKIKHSDGITLSNVREAINRFKNNE